MGFFSAGLCQMIRQNPNGVFAAFAYVCDAFASWGNPKRELKEEFTAILQGLLTALLTI